jgi:hypothetical protein
MKKYGLSARGLEGAFQKLARFGALSGTEIIERSYSGDDTVLFKSTRIIPRHILTIPMPIYEMDSYPETIGEIRDITEQGLGISGIDAEVGETKTFSIFPNEFLKVQPFSFKAECRWIEGHAPGDSFGGFYICEISQESQEKLQLLIRELRLGDR